MVIAEKLKCNQCGERDVFSKGLCTRCYSRKWYAEKKAERAAKATVAPKQLTSGVTEAELAPTVIEGEIVHEEVITPETHLVALNPAEMQAARGNAKAWLEQRLSILERDIVEANAAINEAKRNGWATSALTNARNRAVEDETFYYKILMAVDAGHTIIPEFPIEVFAVRRGEAEKPNRQRFSDIVSPDSTYLGNAASADCAPAGAGEYRNPQPQTSFTVQENKTPGAQERNEPRYYTTVRRTGRPVGPIVFPSMTARSPIMRATAEAMKEKVFDQIGVCHPMVADASTAARRVETNARRAGDPLVIGQILHKRVGSKQKAVSFIIAWYLNLEDL